MLPRGCSDEECMSRKHNSLYITIFLLQYCSYNTLIHRYHVKNTCQYMMIIPDSNSKTTMIKSPGPPQGGGPKNNIFLLGITWGYDT